MTKRVNEVLRWLKRHGTKRNRADLGPRYGIHTTRAFGVSLAKIHRLAKQVGKDHELAAALWATGWYEARLLTAFIDDPARVTAVQMDRWCRDFDNWGVCDTMCFQLFDRTPHAWRKVEQWSRREGEFVKRGAFALLASLALHDKQAADAPFVRSLRLIDRAATRRAQLRQEGGELGVARHRPAQSGAQPPRGRHGAAAGAITRQGGAMDRKRCPTRAHQSGVAATARRSPAYRSGGYLSEQDHDVPDVQRSGRGGRPGGEPGRCGWLKDRFGVSWQIIPATLGKMLGDKDAGGRVLQAMLQMNKLDLGKLQQAYQGK